MLPPSAPAGADPLVDEPPHPARARTARTNAPASLDVIVISTNSVDFIAGISTSYEQAVHAGTIRAAMTTTSPDDVAALAARSEELTAQELVAAMVERFGHHVS